MAIINKVDLGKYFRAMYPTVAQDETESGRIILELKVGQNKCA